MWRNLRPYPDAKLQPWPPPSASGRGSSLHDAFAVRRLIQPRLSERQPSSRVGDGEREARGRVEPGCRRRRHRSARVAPCRIAEARSQARGPSSVAALVTKRSSRGGRAHDRSSGKGVAGVGRRRRAHSWHTHSAVTRRRAIALTRQSRGDGGCRTAPLARYRLAPRRREITFGRQSSHAKGDRSDAESDRPDPRRLGIPRLSYPSRRGQRATTASPWRVVLAGSERRGNSPRAAAHELSHERAEEHRGH
jgi:hypothetical protein